MSAALQIITHIGLYPMCVKQCKGVERPVSRSVYSFIAFVELRLSSPEKQQPRCCLFRHLNDWWKLLEGTAALESRLTLIREKDVHIPPPTYTQRRGLKSWLQSFSNCQMLQKKMLSHRLVSNNKNHNASLIQTNEMLVFNQSWIIAAIHQYESNGCEF